MAGQDIEFVERIGCKRSAAAAVDLEKQYIDSVVSVGWSRRVQSSSWEVRILDVQAASWWGQMCPRIDAV